MDSNFEIYDLSGCSNGMEHLFDAASLKPPLKQLTFDNRDLPSTNEKYSSVCFCCFATHVPLTNANNCRHKEFVNVFLTLAPSIPLLICNICHHMLKKIAEFRLQIQNNFSNLVSKKVPEERCLIINNLNRNPTISLVSINPTTDNNIGTQNNDPLFVPNMPSDVVNLLGIPGISSEALKIKAEAVEDPNTELIPNKDENMPSELTQYYMEITPTSIKEEAPSHMPPLTFKSPNHQQKLEQSTTTINNDLILLNPLINPLPESKENKQIVSRISSDQDVKLETLLNPINRPLISRQRPETSKEAANNDIPKVYNEDSHEKETISEIGKLLKNYEYKLLDFMRRSEKHCNSDKGKQRKTTDKKPYYGDTVIDRSYSNKINMIALSEAEIVKEIENDRLEESFVKSKHRCESCIESFQYDFGLDRHNERFHRKKNNDIECPICKRHYSSEKNMEDHSRKHFIRYVCLVCKLQSKTLPSLTEHYNDTHTDKEPIKNKYECKDCDFFSYCKGMYNHHRYNNHKLFTCRICKKQLTGSASQRYHMKYSHEDKEEKKKDLYYCDQCPATFPSCGLYTTHKKTVHPTPGESPTPVFCKPCNKFLSTKYIYRNHLKNSAAHLNGILKYECEECNEKFRTKRSIRLHIERKHLNIYNHRCNICNKLCVNDQCLNKHIRTVHEKKRPPKTDVCHVCGKFYSSKQVLQKHMRIHTGERPYACDLCGMSFAQSSTLYTHRKLKHKILKKNDVLKEDSAASTSWES